jgi:outer membrane protein assembly factor BamB
MFRAQFVIILTLLAAAASPLSAADWPRWRGPNGTGISSETGLLTRWPDKGPPVAWHAEGLGDGYASVVIANGLVFTIGSHASDLFAYALDENDGSLRWKQKIGTTGRHPLSTPTVDADHLYVMDPDGQLLCLEAASGTIRWQRDLPVEFGGRLQSGRGYGESPLIDGDRLICTPGGPDAMIVALDKLTGTTIWKSTIPPLGEAGRDGASFSSIQVSRAAGIRQYVQLVGRGLVGVAADDGRFLWGYNDIANQTANIPTPIVRDDLVFSANGYNAGSVLLKLTADGKGGVQASEVYRLNGSQLQNHHGGLVLVGDHVYGGHGSNNGLPTCLQLASGRVVWKRRGPGVGSASVVYADGHLYFHYQNGLIALIQASTSGYRLKSTFELPGAGADSWSHPVIANGRLYLREKDKLWTYHIKGDAPDVNIPPLPLPIKPGPVLQALAKKRASLKALDPKTSRLISKTGESPAITVMLTSDHISDNGTIRPEIHKLLTELATPCILYIGGTRLGDAGLQQIATIPAVLGLNLELCRALSDDGLSALGKATQLRLLDLTGTRISDAGLPHLLPLKNLAMLSLEVCDGVTDAGCTTLGKMTSLRSLILKKTGFEPDCITNTGLKQLSNLTQLQVLNLYGNRINDEGTAALESLGQLQELDLSLLAISDESLVHLRPLKKLERLELLYSEGFGGTNLSDIGMATFVFLPKLRSLNLVGAKITDAGLAQLGQLKTLKQLQITNTPVSDEAVKRLQVALPGCEIRR